VGYSENALRLELFQASAFIPLLGEMTCFYYAKSRISNLTVVVAELFEDLVMGYRFANQVRFINSLITSGCDLTDVGATSLRAVMLMEMNLFSDSARKTDVMVRI